MAQKVVPYSREWEPAVAALNERLRQGGEQLGFYESHTLDWPPKKEGDHVYREAFLAVDEGDVVRGGYVLRSQEFWIQGTKQILSSWQGPVTEGAIAPKYGMVFILLLQHMTRRQPLVFSWGHGGFDEKVPQMLRQLGWLMHKTPLCVRIARPHRVLRSLEYLRSTPLRRLILDGLAFSGLGTLAISGFHKIRSLHSVSLQGASGQVLDHAPEWADALWESTHQHYSCVARRDRRYLEVLFGGAVRDCILLGVFQGKEPVGWVAVKDTQMKEDKRFGNLRIGSIIDAFGPPQDAAIIIKIALDYLLDRGVDAIFSNQSHPEWIRAFSRNACIVSNNRRIFAASKQLVDLLSPFSDTKTKLYLTLGDGDGPSGF